MNLRGNLHLPLLAVVWPYPVGQGLLGDPHLLPGRTVVVALLQDQLHCLGLEFRRGLLANNDAYFFTHRQTPLVAVMPPL
jgi:hypothetical protein